jgi:molybdopterin synthase sulfur carrier subunit
MAPAGAVREGGSSRVTMLLHIPSALRRWTAGRDIIEIPLPLDTPVTVADLIEIVGREYPGIRQRVLDDQGELRRHVNVFVNGEDVRSLSGLATQLGPDSEVWIHPALSGGT